MKECDYATIKRRVIQREHDTDFLEKEEAFHRKHGLLTQEDLDITFTI